MGGRTTCAALLLLLALLLSVQGGEASGAAAAKAEPEFYPPDGMHVAMYILVGIALLVAAGGGVGGERRSAHGGCSTATYSTMQYRHRMRPMSGHLCKAD